MSLACKVCKILAEDSNAIFCWSCGSQVADVRDIVTIPIPLDESNIRPAVTILAKLLAFVIIFIIIFAIVSTLVRPMLLDSSGSIQFELKSWEIIRAETDHLSIESGWWVRAGDSLMVDVYNLNETDPYLLRVVEYTHKTDVIASREYNISHIVNTSIRYIYSDFVYLGHQDGNISITLFRGEWMQYNDPSGNFMIINRSSLVYLNAIYIIPAI